MDLHINVIVTNFAARLLLTIDCLRYEEMDVDHARMFDGPGLDGAGGEVYLDRLGKGLEHGISCSDRYQRRCLL